MIAALLALTRHPDQDLSLPCLEDKGDKLVTTAESKPSVVDEDMKDEQKVGEEDAVQAPTPDVKEKEEKSTVTQPVT